MSIQIFTSSGIWPTSESQRKLRELWGVDSGPFLELVAEELEAKAAKGDIYLYIREVTIGAKDYLVVNVGGYSITPDIAQIVVNAGNPAILRILSSTCPKGEVIDSQLVEKIRDAKIDGGGCISILEAQDRYGGKVLVPILEAIKGGLIVEDAVSVVIAEVEHGGDASELMTVRPRAELNRRF